MGILLGDDRLVLQDLATILTTRSDLGDLRRR